MKVVVKKMGHEKAVLGVETSTGVKELTIEKTDYGHRYSDFSEWDIGDKEYYELEEFVDSITDKMSGNTSLDVEYGFLK